MPVCTTSVYKNGFVLPTNVIVCKSLSSSFNPPRRPRGTNAGLTDVEEWGDKEDDLFFNEVMVTSLTWRFLGAPSSSLSSVSPPLGIGATWGTDDCFDDSFWARSPDSLLQKRWIVSHPPMAAVGCARKASWSSTVNATRADLDENPTWVFDGDVLRLIVLVSSACSERGGNWLCTIELNYFTMMLINV